MNKAIEIDRKTNKFSDWVDEDCQEFPERSSKDVQTIGSNDFKEIKREIVVKNMQIKGSKKPQSLSSERSGNPAKTPKNLKDLKI